MAQVDSLAGKRVRVADAYAVAGAVERYYGSRGYFLTRVVIPPQQVRDGGTLTMRVVDGFIESVDVSALPSRIRSRVESMMAELVGKKQLQYPLVERRLLLAGDTPGATLKSTIVPGRETGSVRLVVSGEHRLIEGEVAVDNSVSTEFGIVTVTTSVAVNSPFGFGEQIYGSVGGPPTHGFIGSEALRRFGVVGTTVPLGVDGLLVNVEGVYSTTRPFAAPGTLPTESDYFRASIRLLYPLIRARNETLMLRLGFEVINENQRALGFDTTLYADRIRPLRAGATWTRSFDTGTQIMLAGDLSRGLGIFGSRGRNDATVDFPISRAQADDDFTKAEIKARVFQQLPKGFGIEGTFNGQYAFNGSLVNAEQFTLGGPRRLSALDQSTLAGDHGWLVRGELQYAEIFDVAQMRVLLTPYAFAARGMVYLDSPTVTEFSSNGAWSLGLGVRSIMSNFLSFAREGEFGFEVARNISDRAGTLDNWRVNFNGAIRF
jgi:hemolysin activation/secretion protein